MALDALQTIKMRNAGGVSTMDQESQMKASARSIDYDARTIQGGEQFHYQENAVGEMNMHELDELARVNADRVRDIENRYNFKNKSIKPYIEIIHAEKELYERPVMDTQIDSFPTYGRGL